MTGLGDSAWYQPDKTGGSLYVLDGTLAFGVALGFAFETPRPADDTLLPSLQELAAIIVDRY